MPNSPYIAKDSGLPATLVFSAQAYGIAMRLKASAAHTGQMRRALSLTELVVVVAIIGILAMLLIPLVDYTRESARQTRCAANFRQIGTAIQLYYVDNDGWLPIAADVSQGEIPNRTQFGAWYWNIAPYLEIPRDETAKDLIGPVGASNRLPTNFVLLCPSHHEAENWSANDKQHRPVSYAPTIQSAQSDEAIRISDEGNGIFRGHILQVREPARKVFIVESTNPVVANVTGAHRWEPSNFPQNLAYRSFSRHRGRGNALFFDGRVQHFEADELYRMHRDEPAKFFGLFHPWH